MDIQAYIQSGIIESYVLGLASTEEVAELEKLRHQYTEIDQAIEEFSISLEEQALKNAITPPPDVKAHILQAIREAPEQHAVAAPVPSPTNGPTKEYPLKPVRNMRPYQWVAAASIILLIISGGFNIYQYNLYSQKDEAYQALVSERNSLVANNKVYQTKMAGLETAMKMMSDPAMAVVKMNGALGKQQHEATVFWDTRNRDVYVMPSKLPEPAAGKQYQLWALVDGKPVDAGVLDKHCTGVCKMKKIPAAQGFAITLETDGGSPVPNLQALYVSGKVVG